MRKIYAIIFTAAFFVSCSRNIPEETMVSIFYEMYLIDAVSSVKAIANEDSVKIYEPIVQKYGYHLEDVNRTILNYALMNGKLDSIFNELKRKIENEKLIYKPLARIEKLSANLLTGTDSVTINSAVHSKRSIELVLEEKGVYDISASHYFFDDDSTRNPRMSVWLESSTKDSTQWQEIALVKDSVFNNYSLRIEFNNTKYNRLKGYWLNYDELIRQKKLTELPINLNAKNKNRPKPAKSVKPVEEIKRYQHFTIKNMLIKYNFEESDTTKIKLTSIDSLKRSDSLKQTDSVSPTGSDSLKNLKKLNIDKAVF